MNQLLRLSAALAVLSALTSAHAAGGLPRSEPEREGVSSERLLEFVSALDRDVPGMHSVMILRHGKVIAEGWWAPYAASHNHVLYSLSKSFTSTAVGFAVAEGKLDLSDPVVKFFPDKVPAQPSENLKAMRVHDLLTMSTGHQAEPPTGPDTVSAASFLAHPVPHKPGTHFKYNTAATFMQSAIVQKVTGKTVLEYLRPRLFEPLGIANPVWETNFEGIPLGGYGLRVRTEDIAKLGRFYLQKGKWAGKQLLPAEWVEQATSRQVANGSNPKSDWNQGYGFQFWRCRHNAYRGDGAFGQYCVVMPDQDMVVAITSGVKNMQAVLNMVWEKLLPAVEKSALAENSRGVKALREKLASLELPPAQGGARSAAASEFLNRRFVFPESDQRIKDLILVSPDGGKTLELVTRIGAQENRVPCAHGKWAKGRAAFAGGRLAQFADEPVAGSFAWKTDDTCVIKICAYETPFAATMQLKFADETVTLTEEANVAFGPTKRPPVVGRGE